MFKRILVPFDESEGASNARDCASAMAAAAGGRVRLVHFVDVLSFPNAHGLGEPIIRSAGQAAELLLEKGKRAVETLGSPCDTQLSWRRESDLVSSLQKKRSHGRRT